MSSTQYLRIKRFTISISLYFDHKDDNVSPRMHTDPLSDLTLAETTTTISRISFQVPMNKNQQSCLTHTKKKRKTDKDKHLELSGQLLLSS